MAKLQKTIAMLKMNNHACNSVKIFMLVLQPL